MMSTVTGSTSTRPSGVSLVSTSVAISLSSLIGSGSGGDEDRADGVHRADVTGEHERGRVHLCDHRRTLDDVAGLELRAVVDAGVRPGAVDVPAGRVGAGARRVRPALLDLGGGDVRRPAGDDRPEVDE